MKIKILALLYFILLSFISCSRDEPALVTPPPPEVQEVKINEVYSRGDSVNADWIEIYNPASSQVDLSGYKIYNSGGKDGSKPKKEFPTGTVIPANGFFIIVVDDSTTTSVFDLSSNGETVWLEKTNGSIIDSISFPALGIDTSYGRKPDGSTTWDKIIPPTKGSTNTPGGVTNLPLVMNEIYSRGVPTAPDWIELYNPNTIERSLSGYKIYDIGGKNGGKPKKEFPAGSVIPANGFFVIVTDNSPDPTYFGLSSAGEEVWLENSSGTLIDDVTFPAMPDTTTSYGRLPDGSTNWQILTTRTRGSSNQP